MTVILIVTGRWDHYIHERACANGGGDRLQRMADRSQVQGHQDDPTGRAFPLLQVIYVVVIRANTEYIQPCCNIR